MSAFKNSPPGSRLGCLLRLTRRCGGGTNGDLNGSTQNTRSSAKIREIFVKYFLYYFLLNSYLTVLIALIGIGSFLWHTLATRWAALADIVPIAAFIHLYLIAFVRRLYRPPWWIISAVLSVYLGVETALAWLLPRGALNGSVGYLAPLLTLPLLAWLAQRRGVDGAQARCQGVP